MGSLPIISDSNALSHGMIDFERERLEMKKVFGMVLLSSALLLSNNSNAEASYSMKDVQIQNVHNIKFGSFITNGISLNKTISSKDKIELYIKFFNEQVKLENKVEVSPSKPTPEENGTPIKPDVQPAPEAQPAPEENIVPSKPEVQPVPEENVAPSKPEAQPVPEENVTPSQPVEQPTPEETVAPSDTEVAPAPTTPAESTSVSAIEQAVLNLTNVERQKAGLSALQADGKLMESARAKSVDMSSKGYFSHTSPTYGSPFDQMKQFGVSYKLAGENIAMGQRTAEEVVKAWMDSPGHRENILKSGFTHIGIGYDANGNYWTQQFIQK